MWFIGLEFAKTENLNVDLTYDIQTFTENVNRHATNIKILKDGMKVEAKHVKRRHLSNYIAPSLLKRERKPSVNSSLKNGLDTKKRPSDGGDESQAKKKTRLSEDITTSSVSENINDSIIIVYAFFVFLSSNFFSFFYISFMCYISLLMVKTCYNTLLYLNLHHLVIA